jgi:hypothetical protein
MDEVDAICVCRTITHFVHTWVSVFKHRRVL